MTQANVSNVASILIPLIRKTLPNLIATNIVGVQPMTGPTGLVYSLRSQYGNTLRIPNELEQNILIDWDIPFFIDAQGQVISHKADAIEFDQNGIHVVLFMRKPIIIRAQTIVEPITSEKPGKGHLIQLTEETRIQQNVARATAMKYLIGKGDVYVDPFTLQVDAGGSVKMNLEADFYKEIPLNFFKVDGDFDCQQAAIESFKNVPRVVTGNCILNNCAKVSSLEGLPQWVGGRLNIHRCNIKSFHNIHKMVQHARSIYFSSETTHDLLGLILIKGLEEIRCMVSFEDPQGTQERLEIMNKILNKHLAAPRDVLKCQDELIDAGFVTQAKL